MKRSISVLVLCNCVELILTLEVEHVIRKKVLTTKWARFLLLHYFKGHLIQDHKQF